MGTNEEINQFLFYLKYYMKSLNIIDITVSLCHRKLNMQYPIYINQCNFNLDNVLIINDWSFLNLKHEIDQIIDIKGIIILYERILNETLDVINKTRVVVCVYLAYKIVELFNCLNIEPILIMSRILHKFINSKIVDQNFYTNLLIPHYQSFT
ncbi:hypothetical protein LDVICp070 [lymphocystis disease virus-China]|uniref:Uncharacterized protein n=2 Tax=Lymphocystis disease virus 2 TaxID=159183 RepID=A0A6F8X0G0_9VIRU|nr:hypothetical protein LDVICp070 [lymphocystis disease virus-China]AAU10916.1 hypothetical protein [lymphocystis disease virus-China]BCB67454.1 hypothetical protein [Lymphocystis disease virus 2]